jgi:hypothetical protein
LRRERAGDQSTDQSARARSDATGLVAELPTKLNLGQDRWLEDPK